MLFVAASLFHHTGTGDVGSIEAAHAGIAQLVGGGAALAFAVALLASGLSSSSVGTYAGQVVMQGFIGRRVPLFARRAVTMLPALVVLVACRSPAPAPGSPEALVAYLGAVVGADAATRRREVASWQLPAALWERTVVAIYRPLHADYQRAFAAELPALVDRLARPAMVTARRHWAGDPGLTLAQAQGRWALPTLFPSLVAEAGGAPIDAVFVPDGERWRALVGLDAVVRARVAALDPGCAANLVLAGPTGRCTDVGFAIAEAALRTDRDQLAHVCRLAETLCGKGSP